MPGTEAREDRVRRFFADVWGGQNLAYAWEFFAADAQVSDGVGPQIKIDAVTWFRASFPDLRLSIDRLVADGETVAVQWTVQGTDTVGFLGRPPTGNAFTAWVAEFFHFAGDRVVENWVGVDWLGIMIQLGIVPSPWPVGPG